MVKAKNMTLTAVDVIFVVSVKNVYSAVVCLMHCWIWHCPHGVQKLSTKKETFEDVLNPLLDLRFGDDILVF